MRVALQGDGWLERIIGPYRGSMLWIPFSADLLVWFFFCVGLYLLLCGVMVLIIDMVAFGLMFWSSALMILARG